MQEVDTVVSGKVYAPKVCVKCSKEFEPNSAPQKKCSECATKQAANTISQRASRERREAREGKESAKWNSQTEVAKAHAKEILTERGVKNPKIADLLFELYKTASQHFHIPLNQYLFRSGLRTTLQAIQQKKQLEPPAVEDGMVLGDSGLCVETLFNKDLNAIWDVSLFREPEVSYEQFKQIRYQAKTDAYFLGMQLLSRNFSDCHKHWVTDFYPRIQPDGLVPEYTQAQAKDWWSAQVQSQPREYLQLASRSSFKSSTAVVFLISLILQYADVRCLLVSEVSKLSKDFIKSLRFFFEDPTSRFAQYFPEHQIAPGDSSVLTYETPMARLGLPQPTAHAIGMDSSAQGLRAMVILVDDPISVLTVANEDQRAASLSKYRMLKNVRERDGLAFLVGTPYHPQDLFKAVIDQNEKEPDGSFRYRIDPAFTAKEHAKHIPLEQLKEEDVELLFKEQLPWDELKRALKSDQRFFESQQLCRFLEVTEEIKCNFEEHVLRQHVRPINFFDANPRYRLVETVLGGDISWSVSRYADFTALAVGRTYQDLEHNKHVFVIVDMVMERLRTSEVAARFIDLKEKYNPSRCVIEKSGAWQMLSQELDKVCINRQLPKIYNLYWRPTNGVNIKDRVHRVKSLEMLLNSDQFFITHFPPWTESLIAQFIRYTGEKRSGSSDNSKDDGPDVCSILTDTYFPKQFGEVVSEEQSEADAMARGQAILRAQHEAMFGLPQAPIYNGPVYTEPEENGNPLYSQLSRFGMVRK